MLSEDGNFYIDEGSKLTDYYCPSGFRFLTNTNYIGADGGACQKATNLIRNCWKFYDSVAVGQAFACNGFMMKEMIAIYVKEVIPVRLGNVCDCCEESFENMDIIRVETYFRKAKKLCKNCFNVYSYEEITVGSNVALVARNQ